MFNRLGILSLLGAFQHERLAQRFFCGGLFWPILLLLFLIPMEAFAQIEINEIMYDLSGTDDGREWVEILNTGSEPVIIDVLLWKFFEGNINHGLTLFQGGAAIPAGSFVIIADNPEKFLTDWPGFSGTIFKSSFSLNNSGESVAIKISTTTIADSVVYTAQDSAGNGNSLQKLNGTWSGGLPTPGAVNAHSNSPDPVPEGTGEAQESSQTSPPVSSPTVYGNLEAAKPHIFADAGSDMTVVAGADILFKGKAYGLQKEPLPTARFIWNFGDGGVAEGANVIHVYRYPGTYTVSLDVASGEWSAGDRQSVTVVSSPLSITAVEKGDNGFVEISNASRASIDISSWKIQNGSRLFLMPGNTIVGSNAKIVFAAPITGLIIEDVSDVKLLYPNGVVAKEYSPVPVSAVAEPLKKTEEKSRILPPPPFPKTVPQDNDGGEKAKVSVAASFEAIAAPAEPFKEKTKEGKLWPWVLAIAGLVVISAGSLVFSKGSGEEFTIVDVSDIDGKK